MEGILGLAILTCFVWLCLYWKPRSGMVLQCNNISVTDERHTPGSPKWEEESCKTRPTIHSYFSKPDLKLEISPINKKPRMDDGTILPDVFEFDNEEELNDNQSTNNLENGELIFFRNPFDNRTPEEETPKSTCTDDPGMPGPKMFPTVLHTHVIHIPGIHKVPEEPPEFSVVRHFHTDIHGITEFLSKLGGKEYCDMMFYGNFLYLKELFLSNPMFWYVPPLDSGPKITEPPDISCESASARPIEPVPGVKMKKKFWKLMKTREPPFFVRFTTMKEELEKMLKRFEETITTVLHTHLFYIPGISERPEDIPEMFRKSAQVLHIHYLNISAELLSTIGIHDQYHETTKSSYFPQTDSGPITTEVPDLHCESPSVTKPVVKESFENKESDIPASERDTIQNELIDKTSVAEEEPTAAENSMSTTARTKSKFGKLGSKWKNWKATHFPSRKGKSDGRVHDVLEVTKDYVDQLENGTRQKTEHKKHQKTKHLTPLTTPLFQPVCKLFRHEE
ncbi:hypothetical protein OUZ56_004985 [Daphnia magna]|uniref:Uncharacterized protein n=1 Tax=Daphnia magna TaxID=35525 RepID=A0ABQ9YRT3_9CRUS|nr:hypothetical protein OUZ56_004985 [Daphnia magna]